MNKNDRIYKENKTFEIEWELGNLCAEFDGLSSDTIAELRSILTEYFFEFDIPRQRSAKTIIFVICYYYLSHQYKAHNFSARNLEMKLKITVPPKRRISLAMDLVNKNMIPTTYLLHVQSKTV